MTNTMKGIVKRRQDPLRERYRTVPDEARITDSAKTIMIGSEDPFHSEVVAGEGQGGSWRIGIHRVIGGYHDLPNPGDILCAASPAVSIQHCALLRIGWKSIANLEVNTCAEVDARGFLLVD